MTDPALFYALFFFFSSFFFFFFTTSDYFLCFPLQAPRGLFLLELLGFLASRRRLGVLVIWVSCTAVCSVHQPFSNCWATVFPNSLYFVLLYLLTPGIPYPRPLVFRLQSVPLWCGLSALFSWSLGYRVLPCCRYSLDYFPPDWGRFY